MNENVKKLNKILNKIRFKLITQDFIKSTLIFFCIILFCLGLIQTLFFAFPWIILPLLWDLCLIILLFGIVAIFLSKFVFFKPDLLKVAKIAEKKANLIRPWPSLAFEIYCKDNFGSAELKDLLYQNAINCLQGIKLDFTNIFSRKIVLCFILTLIFFLCSAILFKPQCAKYWNIALYLQSPLKAEIIPGNITIPEGKNCVIMLKPQKKIFPSCRLILYNNLGFLEKRVMLIQDSMGFFSYHLDSLHSSIEYSFSLGNISFPKYKINVVCKPILSSLKIKLYPPSYTGIAASELLEGQGNFAAYAGTKAKIYIAASNSLKEAFFVSSNKDTMPLILDNNLAYLEKTISNSQSYSFILTDTFLQKNDSLAKYFIDIIPDEVPSCIIIKPQKNKDCTPEMKDTIVVEAFDDFGISSLSVITRKNNDSEIVYITKKTDKKEKIKFVTYEFPLDLTKFKMYPGDTLFYRVVVCDNKEYGKPQCSTSDIFYFRMPTFDEIHKSVEREHEYAEKILSQASKQSKDIKKAIEKMANSYKDKKALEWEQKKELQNIKEELMAQADSLSKAMDAFKESVEKLKQNESASTELLNKMEMVKKALEEIIKTYGDSILFTKENAEDISINDFKKNIEDLKNILPEMSQRLDATLNLLKMLKRDLELNKLGQKAERLAKEQQENYKKYPSSECFNNQMNICNKIDSLLNEINQKSVLQSDSSLFSKEDLPSLNSLCPLQKNITNQLTQKMMPQKQDMAKMEDYLMELSSDIFNLQSCSMAKKLEKDKQILLDMAKDGLNSAFWQQSIEEKAKASYISKGDIGNEQQALLNSLLQSQDKINNLSVISPSALISIKRKYDNIKQTINQNLLELASQESQAALKSTVPLINELTKTILDAINELNNQQGMTSSGLMSGIKKLSSKQAMVNAATQELLKALLTQKESQNDASGSKYGKQKEGQNVDRAKKEAQSAQKAIADELEKLSQRYGKESKSSLEKKAKELEEEAKRLVKMFENPSEELKEKQERFLSQLLETTLSVQKKEDEKEERISESAKNIFSKQQKKILEKENFYGPDTYYKIRIKAFSGNYPEGYLSSIKMYFDSLSILYLKEKK